jgi:NADH:ubiquinone oxidoreductase subunit 6 (subunit J)
VRPDLDARPRRRLVAALAGVGVAGLIGGTLALAVGDSGVTPDLARGQARPLGAAIFGGWLLPFELLSVLLLAALVAALAVSKGVQRR